MDLKKENIIIREYNAKFCKLFEIRLSPYEATKVHKYINSLFQDYKLNLERTNHSRPNYEKKQESLKPYGEYLPSFILRCKFVLIIDKEV